MLQAIIPTPQITLGSTKLPFGQTTPALAGLTQITLNPLGNTNNVVVSSGSDSGSATNPLGLIVTGTLDTTGVVDGVVMFANITNTESGAGTLLADLQVGGSSKFSIDMVGDVVAAGTLTATKINGLTIPTTTGTLSVANAKTFTASNPLILAGTDGSTLNVGAGGTLGSNAFTSTAYAPLASPTFSGSVTFPDNGTYGVSGISSTTINNSVIGGTTAAAITGTTIIATGQLTVENNSGAVINGGVKTVVGSTTGFGIGWQSASTFAGVSGAVIGFTSSSTNGSGNPDTAFSRISAGIIGVGTGAQGSVAGGLQAATVALSPAANTTPLSISGGSITGSSTTSPGISITGTLNTTGNVDGAAILANITNTASGASTVNSRSIVTP